MTGLPKPLAIIAHGGGGKNSDYSFIADALVARGYAVAAPQLELAGDLPPTGQGPPAVVRRPVWRRGATVITFLVDRLRATGVASDGPALLVGHSNGGDTAMLLAGENPSRWSAVMSLDSRRMPFARTAKPRICSVRSADQLPDPGVLPTLPEQARFGMLIESVPGLKHDDMWDGATQEQKASMLSVLTRCLAKRGVATR